MVVRGVYTKEEEEMIANWKRRAEGLAYWIGEERKPGTTMTLSSSVATKDLISRYVTGQRDRNPLYSDENYARYTRWGGIIAPPLFPNAICGKGRPLVMLDVPRDIGSPDHIPGGTKWEFYKPIHVGDTFRVRVGIYGTLEDKTNLDGKGPRLFQAITYRKYINQKDEVVAIGYGRDFLTPGVKGDEQPLLPLLPFTEYRYTKEEIEFTDRIYDEEEIRGDETRYWEDVDIGDELKPIVCGPWTFYDEVTGTGSTGSYSRELRKKNPKMFMVDPVTLIPHPLIELHYDNRVAQLMGGTIAIVGRFNIERALGRLITNWMGDDGFLKMVDIWNHNIVPIGDAFFCRGKVTNKRVENGEYLIDLMTWVETSRGYITMWSPATVSLFSRHEV